MNEGGVMETDAKLLTLAVEIDTAKSAIDRATKALADLTDLVHEARAQKERLDKMLYALDQKILEEI